MIPKYDEKINYLIKQLETLQQAESDVISQISEWNQKKDKQVEMLINSHTSTQVEQMDSEIGKLSVPLEKTAKELKDKKIELIELKSSYSKKEHEMISKLNDEEKDLEELNEKYSNACALHEKEIMEVEKISKSLKEAANEVESRINEIKNKLNDAEESYKAAKDAEASSQKLVYVPQKVSESLYQSKDNPVTEGAVSDRIEEDKLELLFPKISCLPLQQSEIPNIINERAADKSLENFMVRRPSRYVADPEPMVKPESPTNRTQCSTTDSYLRVPFKPDGRKKNIKVNQRYVSNTSTLLNSKPDANVAYLNPIQSQKENWGTKLWQISKNSISTQKDSEFDLLSSFSVHPPSLASLKDRLVHGHDFYKKFSTKYSAKLPVFDPFKAKFCPPSHCGYGLRHFSLSNNMENILVGNLKGENGDYVIPIKTIVRPIIPRKTAEIIRAQKNFNKNDINDPILKDYVDCKYYPFVFELEGRGKLELIATNYKELKLWVIGIGMMTKNDRIDDLVPTKEYTVM